MALLEGHGPQSSEIDVLIIGAGPAGLMAANWFARTGIKTRIIDKRATQVFTGQADGLQPRTTEVFHSFGFGERLLKEAQTVPEVCFWEPDENGSLHRKDRQAGGAPLGASRFCGATLHQGRVEDIFMEEIYKYSDGSIQVERLKSIENMEIDEMALTNPAANPIIVTIKQIPRVQGTPDYFGHEIPNGLYRQFGDISGDQSAGDSPDIEIVRAKYVLACDGAHSWTRKKVDISMVGESADIIWGVLDIIRVTDFPDIRKRCTIHSEHHGAIMVIPRDRGLVRLYIQLQEKLPTAEDNTEVKGRDGDQAARVDRSKITPELILASAKKIFYPYTIDAARIEWFTAYQVGQRIAERFVSHGRVFLAGDACHTHSPKAGQGMNVSMMDTYNLAWKIAHVLKNISRPEILDTYEQERRQVALDLISFDYKLSRLWSKDGKSPSDTQDQEEYSQAFRSFIKQGSYFASGFGVNYGRSLLTEKPAWLSSDDDYINPLAKKCLIGRRFPSANVVCESDGIASYLSDRIASDGRWRVIYFCGDFKKVPRLAKEMKEFGEYLKSDQSFVRKYSSCLSLGKVKEAIEVLLVHASARTTTEWDDFPIAFRPRDNAGCVDYWRIFADDVPFYGNAGDAYHSYGIDPHYGAVIVIRPDQYVANVVPPNKDGITELERFFQGFLVVQEKIYSEKTTIS